MAIIRGNLGVVSIPVVVIANISFIGIGTLVSALLLAVWPALAAARSNSGDLMREERVKSVALDDFLNRKSPHLRVGTELVA